MMITDAVDLEWKASHNVRNEPIDDISYAVVEDSDKQKVVLVLSFADLERSGWGDMYFQEGIGHPVHYRPIQGFPSIRLPYPCDMPKPHHIPILEMAQAMLDYLARRRVDEGRYLFAGSLYPRIEKHRLFRDTRSANTEARADIRTALGVRAASAAD